MKRVAFWVALAHGVGILAALLLIRSPGSEAPKPMSVRLQSEGLAPAAVVSMPPKIPKPPAVPPQPSPALRDVRPLTRSAPNPAAGVASLQEEAAATPPAVLSASGSGLATDDRQPMVDASFRGNRDPNYPAISRRLGEQGIVVLRVLITPDGRASEVQIIKTSGSERLDGAAVETVKDWRFVPAFKGGRPVSAWYEWRWEFRLNQ